MLKVNIALHMWAASLPHALLAVDEQTTKQSETKQRTRKIRCNFQKNSFNKRIMQERKTKCKS